MAKNEKSAAAEKIQAAEKVKAKKPKSDKPNIFVRAWKAIVRFFRDLRGETKKIVWPDGKTVLKNTLVVLAVIAVFTIIIGLIDLGLSKSIGWLSDAARGQESEAVTETVDDDTTANTTANAISENIDIEAAPEEAAEAATDAAAQAATDAAEAVTQVVEAASEAATQAEAAVEATTAA